MKFLFKIVTLVITIGVLGIAGVMFFDIASPGTPVYTGAQLPAKYLASINKLNLLDEGESVRYFYSDGYFNVERGMYFVTDRKLVLYSSEWTQAEIIMPFGQIQKLAADFDESSFKDSTVQVIDKAGNEVYFPVSSENGLDKKFVEAIQNGINEAQSGLNGIFEDPGSILDIVIDETVDILKKDRD
ncbi:MAG: hypothetical protein ACPGXK_13190 [Phycisphaerae bacterium]